MRGQGPRRGVIFSGIISGCIVYVGSDWLDDRLEGWIYIIIPLYFIALWLGMMTLEICIRYFLGAKM